MSDHKDITNYAALQTIVLPKTFPIRKLTSAECLVKAAEIQAQLDAFTFNADYQQRWMAKEVKAWRRLARERS